MKTAITGAATVPQTEFEQLFKWIHQFTWGFRHRGARDAQGSLWHVEKWLWLVWWRQETLETASTQVCRGFHTENVNTPASHFLCHVSCSGSTYFLTPDSYHANLAGQVKMLNLLCVTVTINTGHRRMEDMTDGWRSDMINLEWWQVLLVSVQWIYWLAAGSVNGPCNEHQSSLDSWNTFRLSIWNCVSCVSEGVAHSSVRLRTIQHWV